MEHCVEKLAEMNANSNLLTCRYPLPLNDHWQEICTIGSDVNTVWLYKRNGSKFYA